MTLEGFIGRGQLRTLQGVIDDLEKDGRIICGVTAACGAILLYARILMLYAITGMTEIDPVIIFFGCFGMLYIFSVGSVDSTITSALWRHAEQPFARENRYRCIAIMKWLRLGGD